MSRATSLMIAAVLLACFPILRAEAQVTGQILEFGSSDPLDGALVTLQTTAVQTTTDATGNFSLPDASGSDLVIVAAKKGYFNGSVVVSSPASGVQILLELVPMTDDPSYTLVEPDDCGICHPNQVDEWTGSPMSHAGVNTWVYDIYSGDGTPGGMGGFVYLNDSVHAAENPESECASCHQPEPWIATPLSALEDINDLSDGSLRGVSCEVCHKLADVNVDQINYPGLFPGAVTFVRPEQPDYLQVEFGLNGDVDFTISDQMRASYQPQLAAEVCGVCHQDKNDPDGNHDFEEPNGVISEPTYLEWLASPYSDIASDTYASCVDCHMPPSGETTICSVLPLPRDPDTIRSHNVLGTTPFYLENAAELSMVTQTVGDQLEVEVSVFNHQTGHHVPTGVTIRNMILLVEAWREEDGLPLSYLGGQIVHDLGGVGDPAQGYYAGEPGKFFAKVNHDQTGAGPTFFTDATGIQFDSRIPALETDITGYSFGIPANGGTLHVRARLIYRRSFRFLVDAKQWTEDGHGNPLADVQAPYFGHLMEETEDVTVLPFVPPTFLRGDIDGDGQLVLNDPVSLLETLFLEGPDLACPDAADVNDGGDLNLADAVSLLSYLFVPGSPVPPAPGPSSCGEDPTDDSLDPCADSSCF